MSWLKRVLRIGGADKRNPKHILNPGGNTAKQVVQIGDDLEMQVRGFPADLSIEHKKAIIFHLTRRALLGAQEQEFRPGDEIYQGEASIRAEGETYRLEFSLNTLRALTALTVYKSAFDIVSKGALGGVYDYELAEATAEFLKQSAWQEMIRFGVFRHPNSSAPSALSQSPSSRDSALLGDGGNRSDRKH
jgi:hypothetical protein